MTKSPVGKAISTGDSDCCGAGSVLAGTGGRDRCNLGGELRSGEVGGTSE